MVGGLLSDLWQGALELLYPSNIYCACCGDTIDPLMPYSLCGRCVRELHWITEEMKPETEEGVDWDHGFQRAISCARYESRTKEILRRFKYGSQPQLCKGLGQLMLERIETLGLQPDLVVPVPMHRRKERTRGYNQAALLAQAVAEGLQVPYGNGILVRTRGTAAMSVLSAEDRRGNLRGAFEVTDQEHHLSGKRILLVDDVLTTGTTADECSRVLLEAGAKEIELLVFASGEMKS